jgi:hypothetical protein
MSAFDPNKFLDVTITEAQVKRPPLPAGSDFTATIGEIEARTWQGKKDPGTSGIVLDVPLEIDLSAYPDAQKLVGVPKVTLKDGIMLDTTEGGMIDLAPGKNGKLRRYREALGMNVAGVAFSPRAMSGRLIKVKIGHRTYEQDIYEEVAGVAKA